MVEHAHCQDALGRQRQWVGRHPHQRLQRRRRHLGKRRACSVSHRRAPVAQEQRQRRLGSRVMRRADQRDQMKGALGRRWLGERVEQRRQRRAPQALEPPLGVRRADRAGAHDFDERAHIDRSAAGQDARPRHHPVGASAVDDQRHAAGRRQLRNRDPRPAAGQRRPKNVTVDFDRHGERARAGEGVDFDGGDRRCRRCSRHHPAARGPGDQRVASRPSLNSTGGANRSAWRSASIADDAATNLNTPGSGAGLTIGAAGIVAPAGSGGSAATNCPCEKSHRSTKSRLS